MSANRHDRRERTQRVTDVDRPDGHVSRKQALDSLPQVVYAARLDDGVIKFGCTRDLSNRLLKLKHTEHSAVELLGFTPGDFADESALHEQLRPHRARGREFYDPVPAVLDVVNGMRERLGLPAFTAAAEAI